MSFASELAPASERHAELDAQTGHRRVVGSVRGPRQPAYFLGRPADRYRQVFERSTMAS